jgi:hypothetical protein
VGGDGSARRRFSSGVELAAMLVPLEDDDSFSQAGYQAVDEGDDEVRRRFGDDGIQNSMQHLARAWLV